MRVFKVFPVINLSLIRQVHMYCFLSMEKTKNKRACDVLHSVQRWLTQFVWVCFGMCGQQKWLHGWWRYSQGCIGRGFLGSLSCICHMNRKIVSDVLKSWSAFVTYICVLPYHRIVSNISNRALHFSILKLGFLEAFLNTRLCWNIWEYTW